MTLGPLFFTSSCIRRAAITSTWKRSTQVVSESERNIFFFSLSLPSALISDLMNWIIETFSLSLSLSLCGSIKVVPISVTQTHKTHAKWTQQVTREGKHTELNSQSQFNCPNCKVTSKWPRERERERALITIKIIFVRIKLKKNSCVRRNKWPFLCVNSYRWVKSE